MRDEDLPGNAARVGQHLMEGLKELQAEYPIIGDVRGRGLMVGVEFARDGQPDKDAAKAVQKACLERNLLLLTCGTYRQRDPLDSAAGRQRRADRRGARDIRGSAGQPFH